MNEHLKSLYQSLTHWLATLGLALRAALSSDVASADPDWRTDLDFEGWLHNDPMVTQNPASRYGKGARGYITGNGRGSLEIGAADD